MNSDPSQIGEQPPPLGPDDRAALLEIARASVRALLGLGPAPALPAAGPLAAPRGAFVTLRAKGQLRGCVGSFAPSGSLAATVSRMARSAASEDPRFQPVRAAELPDVEVHVSALLPLRRMRDASEIEVGRDGLLVSLGWRRGVLLPCVAAEEGWDRTTFLERTCLKAGLPPDAWRDPAAVVQLFSVEEMVGEPPVRRQG